MDKEALESRLREAPEDEETWAVYADLLLSQGDVRGELIALRSTKPQTPELKERYDTLLEKHRKALLGPLAKSRKHSFEFERGFVSSASLGSQPATALLQLSQRPVGTLLRSVEMRSYAGLAELSDALQVLLNFELRTLAITNARIAKRGCGMLAQSPALVGLESLNLSNNSIEREGAKALAQADFPRLKSLNLSANIIDAKGAMKLATPKNMPSLLNLHLGSNTIRDEGFAALVNGTLSLKTLRVASNQITAQGLKPLQTSAASARLKQLDLSHNRLGASGMEALLRARFCGCIETLILRDTQLDDESAFVLARADLPQLRSLNIQNNPLGEAGISALLNAKGLPEGASLNAGRSLL